MLSQIIFVGGGGGGEGGGHRKGNWGGGLDTFPSGCKKHFPNGQADASMY